MVSDELYLIHSRASKSNLSNFRALELNLVNSRTLDLNSVKSIPKAAGLNR